MKKEQESSLANVLNALKNEKVVAYPTEAVFGLGCDPDSELAVHALLDLKQRQWEKGLILIAANYEQLLPYVDDAKLSGERREEVFSYWPGPVTWVMPAKATTPQWLRGRFSTIAVRVSDHPVVQNLCLQFGKPLVSTSANLSGLEPCRTAQEVRLQFGDAFPVVDAEVGGRLNPSEIRDSLTGELFRQG